ncbi:MAG TPA: hypothetical protein ENG36_01110 [Lentisphaerae bacterium]|nr:hypothetical protein [Lentisphaerota bacterium]
MRGRARCSFPGKILAGMVLLGLTACVTRQVTSDRTLRTTLTTTRVGNRVILAWESRPDTYYTVVYTSAGRGPAPWRPLPGCVRLRGTGGMIVITNYVSAGVERRYRLVVEPAARR